MLRRLSAGLLATAAFVAPLAATAQEGSAEDLGVMSISLADVVKPTIGFQGALQGAGTPNQAGIGGIFPLSVGKNSVWFLDVLANANFADRAGESSIINTDVAGTTISTSSRLGYRLLNGDRSWMYGLNAGYDSRPMNTGDADDGVAVYNKDFVFFQQVAAGLEAVSDTWNFNAYGLFPVGDIEQRLNSYYYGGALFTYGLDIGYFITPGLNASVGYYYQAGDAPCNQAGGKSPDGSGILAKLGYEITDGLTLGGEISHDSAYQTRVLGTINYRFSTLNQSEAVKKKSSNIPVIKSLTQAPSNRNIFVHDGPICLSTKCAGVGEVCSFFGPELCNCVDYFTLGEPVVGVCTNFLD